MHAQSRKPSVLFPEATPALSRVSQNPFHKSDFLHYISLTLPPSSFGFIHQWEVAEGGSAGVRVREIRGPGGTGAEHAVCSCWQAPPRRTGVRRCTCRCCSLFSSGSQVSIRVCALGKFLGTQRKCLSKGRGRPLRRRHPLATPLLWHLRVRNIEPLSPVPGTIPDHCGADHV